MEFRIKAAACVLMFVPALAAQPFTFVVKRGTVTFSEIGVRLERRGKEARAWDYGNIQELRLSPTEIHIRTYEDVRWQLGRDREYKFDRLSKEDTAKLYRFLISKLDQRFIAEIAEPIGAPEWSMPAKMLHRTGGFNGELKIGADRIVFEGAGEHASRTWRISDIQNVSSAGPFELSLTSLDGETRFQLKHALPEDRYDGLWQRVMEANGLKVFQSSMEGHHD